MPARRPARPSSRRRRCGVGPGVSPAVVKATGVPARMQDAPRCSASAGRAGRETRPRTASRPARARRARTRDHRREALPALARRRSRRGPKAESGSLFQSDARTTGCRRAIRPSGVGDPAKMPGGISHGDGLARWAARTGHRRARCRQPVIFPRRIDDWSGTTCALVGRCTLLVRPGAGFGASPRGRQAREKGTGRRRAAEIERDRGNRKIPRVVCYCPPPKQRPAGSVRGRSGDAVRNCGGSSDERGQDGLRDEWAISERGPSRTGMDAKTAASAQRLERYRFRNACGRPRSVGCRSARARPESEWRQWVG